MPKWLDVVWHSINTVSLERLFGDGEIIGYKYQLYCVSDSVLALRIGYCEEAVLCWLIIPENLTFM
jgi:hypothetical protein